MSFYSATVIYFAFHGWIIAGAQSVHFGAVSRDVVEMTGQQTFREGILHTKKDKLSEIRLDDYYQTYRLLSVYLVVLDQALGSSEATPAN
jgi:hypothetical protein